jgi:hypothetical protein
MILGTHTDSEDSYPFEEILRKFTHTIFHGPGSTGYWYRHPWKYVSSKKHMISGRAQESALAPAAYMELA